MQAQDGIRSKRQANLPGVNARQDIAVAGDTITILKAPPKGTFITWTVVAVDAANNPSRKDCTISVVKPPKGDDDDE